MSDASTVCVRAEDGEGQEPSAQSFHSQERIQIKNMLWCWCQLDSAPIFHWQNNVMS